MTAGSLACVCVGGGKEGDSTKRIFSCGRILLKRIFSWDSTKNPDSTKRIFSCDMTEEFYA